MDNSVVIYPFPTDDLLILINDTKTLISTFDSFLSLTLYLNY